MRGAAAAAAAAGSRPHDPGHGVDLHVALHAHVRDALVRQAVPELAVVLAVEGDLKATQITD